MTSIMNSPLTSKVSLRLYTLYFLKLGSVVFGGPIVLASRMHKDLVEDKKWITNEEYIEGMALAQLAPGPLATQLAIYIGWLRAGILGANIAAVSFLLPSFLIVIALSELYIRYESLTWLQGAFYGIGASVIAIVFQGAYKLTKRTLANDKLLWTVAITSALVTYLTETEFVSLFLLAGIVAIIIKTPLHFNAFSKKSLIALPWLFTGIHGPEKPETLWSIWTFFSKSGAVVFGSGLAIVPFLHGGVVNDFHWLTERQFLDAVAIAMITPGPVVITVAFIGYLVSGFTGAFVAALGVFLPCYLFVIIPAPFYRKFSKNVQIKAFVEGVTSAAIGAIAGAALILGRRAIVDLPTIALAISTIFILAKFKKIPEPLIILGAGLIGIAIQS